MSCGNCKNCENLVDQPPIWEHRTVDGVFIKQMHIRQKDTLIPQHSHDHAHTSMLAAGSVRVWVEDQCIGDFKAPHPIFIEARKFHKFVSLEPDTIIYCIHNVSRNGEIQIHKEA